MTSMVRFGISATHILACLLLTVSSAPPFSREVSAGEGQVREDLLMEVDGNRVTLSAGDVELQRLFADLEKKTGVEFAIYADDFRRTVSIAHEPVHLVTSVERILEAAGGGHAFAYITDQRSPPMEYLDVDKVYVVKKAWKTRDPPEYIASVEEVLSLLGLGLKRRALLDLGRSCVPALLEIVKSREKESSIVEDALRILGKIGDPSALPTLYSIRQGLEGNYGERPPLFLGYLWGAITALEAVELYESIPFHDLARIIHEPSAASAHVTQSQGLLLSRDFAVLQHSVTRSPSTRP